MPEYAHPDFTALLAPIRAVLQTLQYNPPEAVPSTMDRLLREVHVLAKKLGLEQMP